MSGLAEASNSHALKGLVSVEGQGQIQGHQGLAAPPRVVEVHPVQCFKGIILRTALLTRAWRWLIAEGASHATSLPWARAVVEESPTSWLLPIRDDQPLRLERSISCVTIHKVMQNRTTRQVGPFYEAGNFRFGQVRNRG